MTQQEQQEFMESLEAALSWMRAVQERLKANDNTQGPRDALEARLRETEKIHQSEHEGRVKMDMVLVAAENLLQSGDEELRSHTHAKLKDLKSLWEETSTYIIHCHSRIEWVWLHWSEYLKAYEEFELWLTKQQRNLDVGVEHQVGVKEKQWQVDQQRVVVSDIQAQAALLERLLDEAAALHNRTQDPSVDPQAQERMQEGYNDVRDRAEVRHLFDALDDSVACEEKTLQHIEGVAESVRATTSPAGAEVVVEEAEELRLGWQRLRQGLCEAEEGLRSSLDSHSQYVARCLRLGEDISRLRLLLQGLDQELEDTHKSRDHSDHTEEQIVGQWRKYTGVRNTLAGEESQVELLKAQLKELFRFSEDSRHLSDDVLAVVKEHQSVKCRATRLCSESESGLRSILQDPLLVYAQWSHMVAQVLETSAEVTDFSHIAMLDSVQLQERFSLLQVKGDLLDSVFGLDRSDGLQGELNAAIRNRELLHAQLLQRKSRLQVSACHSFGFTSFSLPLIVHLMFFYLQVKVNESEESIAEHESFHERLLNIEKWLMIMKQKLESFHSPSGEWSVEGRQHEAERVLGEFPGKDLQLHQMEVQGQRVLERTSEEGQVHILRDIKRLKDSWLALYNMSLNLHSKGHKSRRWEFESWLSKQNELLSEVLSSKEALRNGVCFGQEQFQLLLQESQGSEDGSGSAEDVGLEELRYRWMLYKSKLKDAGELRSRTTSLSHGGGKNGDMFPRYCCHRNKTRTEWERLFSFFLMKCYPLPYHSLSAQEKHNMDMK
uniref:Spectrin repeat containing, nuclear envelope family member 3 n=1 Tax=Acanthochromis polyacanthus TaxID=80966 RepID=A0A3Q1F2V9_9TELE